MRNVSAVVLSAFVFAIAGQAHAIPFVGIQNGSFEDEMTGWTVSGGGIDRLNVSEWQASNGDWSVDLNAFSPGAVDQTFDTVIGHYYVISFDLSGNPDGNLPYLKTLDVLISGSSLNSGGVWAYSYDTSIAGNTHADMKYLPHAIGFFADSSSTNLKFESTTTAGAGASGPVIDNVTVVPEPSTMLLFATGLAGIAGSRRKVKNRGR